jgi:hypothetical protein
MRSSRLICAQSLCAEAISHGYRFCPDCRREWPAKTVNCPTCLRWLGAEPSQRVEWQIAPERVRTIPGADYELFAATAFILRLVGDTFSKEALEKLAPFLRDLLGQATSPFCSVCRSGWLLYAANGPRPAFQAAEKFRASLEAWLPKLGRTVNARVRWGLWLDQYVLPLDSDGIPALPPATAAAIFDFEPENIFLSSEPIYRATRHWENFVAVPRRLSDEKESHGYRFTGHKKPATSQKEASDAVPFVGRHAEMEILDQLLCQSRTAPIRAAVIAPAGSGKTRLIGEWSKRRSQTRVLAGSFSLFAGDLLSFVGQLVTLPERLDPQSLLSTVLRRISEEDVQALIVDDLHWADEPSGDFVHALLDSLSTRPMLVLLVSRPSGLDLVNTLAPQVEFRLEPLPKGTAEELARRLLDTDQLAAAAAVRSAGNPLFVVQFAAWAKETGYEGGASGPWSLSELVAARIAYLATTRVAAIDRRVRWGPVWDRDSAVEEADKIETEIGSWLDRLETGDYGTRTEVARHLIALEALDFELFMIRTLAGKPRPRSGRLKEAIERLLLGSVEEIWHDLEERARNADPAEKINLIHEAERAGECAFDVYQWRVAERFFALAMALGGEQATSRNRERWEECRRRGGADSDTPAIAKPADTTRQPAVDARRLPEIWLALGTRHERAAYLRRAAEAARAINDVPLEALAKASLERLREPAHEG